jgi:hypothetical protein
MRIRKKRSSITNLIIAVLAVPLSLSSAGTAYSATVDFDNPMTITNGYSITDYRVRGKTQLGVDFTGETGVWLSMDSSSSLATVDEYFAFKLENSSGVVVDKISFEFIKPNGEDLYNKPHAFEWASSLYGDRGMEYSVGLLETENSVRVEMTFVEGAEWYAGEIVYLTQNWDLFNYPGRVDWLLNIDLNEKDNNNPLISTPIPGAVWLLGSGLICLFAVSRRKQKG